MVDLVEVGLVLVLAGFGILAASLFTKQGKSEGQVKGGGVIMIGPLPIIFGTDAKWVTAAIALAIVLIVVTIILSLV